MRNIYSLLAILLISGYSVFAQQTTFQAQYSFGSFSIPILTDIIQNPSGQYLMTGTDGTLPIRGTVTLIDSGANVIWSHEYVSSIQTEIVDVKNVAAGGYIVTGESNPGLMLMRLDASGNTIWSNTYHVASGVDEYASRVLPTSDGGFVVAGYVYSATPPGFSRQDSANCYIMKVNSAGALLWAKVVFCSTAYINDHVLNDVAESADGYVFVGSMSQGAADAAGTFGLVIKTDFNGNVMQIRHWGASGNDVEATSVSSLTTTTQLIGGDDNSESFVVKFNSGTISGGGYKYTGLFGGFPPYLNFNAVPTFDGNYAMIGMAPLGFESYIMKVNSTNGNLIWGEQYNGGFASLLPEGRQVADSGFIMVTTALGGNGYVYLVVKTNSTGQTPPAACSPPTSFSPTKATYSPTYTSFTPDSITTTVASSFSPAVVIVHPTDSIHCIAIVCTAPPVPTTSSASPSTVCSGSPSTITGSGSGSVTYNVYATATGGNPIGVSPYVVNPTTTTTYYVEASSGSGCVSTSRQAVTITVTQGPGAVGSITGNTTPCVGAQAYSISAVTNATTYAWSVSGGGSITGGAGTTNITVTWTTAGGPYTVSVTASNSCGSATNSVAVTVGSAPGAATASVTPNPVCAGNNVTLNSSSSGATSYSWSGPGGFSSTLQNPAINGVLANQAGTYTVTASNACGSVTASASLVVNSKPSATTASASPNPACQGQTVNLTGGSTGETSWAWSGPQTYSSTLQSPSITNIQANQGGTYTLIATNTCGNDTATVNLVVNTKPTAVVATAFPNPVCVGDSVRLNGSATGAVSYSWTGPNSFTSAISNPLISSFVTADSGVYTLSATNTCGTTTGTVRVTIGTIPTAVTATASTTSTCFGTTIRLFGTASGATDFSWTGPNGFTSGQQNDSIVNSVVADSGAYVLTVSNGCGTATSTVVINVDTLIQNFSGYSRGGDTLCTAYQLILDGVGQNINSWLWVGPNGFRTTSQDTVVNNAQLVNSGLYILTATNACGSISDSTSVYIENGSSLNLVASSSATNDSACFGNTINLFATDSFDSYNWLGPNGFVSFLQNPTIVNGAVSQSGVYVVTAQNHCSSRADSVHIYIDTIPQGLQLTTSSVGNASCQGQSITVTAASPGITNWSWTGPANFSSNQASFTINNIQPNQQGNYVVTATNSCGTNNDTIVVTVYTLPDSLFVGYSADSICPGLSVTLNAAQGLTNVVWSNSQTGSSISATQPGLYYYTAQDANSCTVHSDSINVYNAVPPTLNLFSTNPTSICQGQQVVVLHASSDLSETFTWGPSGSTADSLVVTASGVYSVVAGKNGCFTADTVTIVFAPIPTIAFTDTTINTCCLNVEFTPVVTGAVATYQWSDTTTNATDVLSHTGVYTVTVTSDKNCTASGTINFNKVCISATALATPDSILLEGSGGSSTLNVTTLLSGNFSYLWVPSDSILNYTSSTVTVSPKQTTTYTVVVYDTVSGCTDTTSVQVYVKYEYNFAVPNVFSPNNDGFNDTWGVITQGGLVTIEDIKVFDRWGETVFDSQRDGSQDWNGKYQGKEQLMGNYVYLIKLKINATSEEKVLRGNLALIR